MEFRYALREKIIDDEMVLLDHPYVLNTLGISVLFWMLPTTPTNCELLKAVMERKHLNNCFAEELSFVEVTSKLTALFISENRAVNFKIDKVFTA